MAASAARAEKARFTIGLFSLMGITALLCLLVWAVVVPLALGWSSVAVLSGSMEPGIEAGDVVVTSPHDGTGLGPGTVIVFKNPAGEGQITHRIVDIAPTGEYVTRGDRNGRVDSDPVTADQVVGVGRILVPFVGKPYAWVYAGAWLNLVLAGIMAAAAFWTARWALLDRFNPWREPGETVQPAGLALRVSRADMSALVVVLLVGSVVTGTGSTAAFAATTGNGTNSWTADVLQAPTSVTATDGSTITIDWTATADTYATGHRVLRASSPGGPYSQIAQVTPRTTTTYDDTPATGLYYYVVRAYYQNWESGNSNEADGYTGTRATYGSTADTWGEEDRPNDNYGTDTEMVTQSGNNSKNGRSFVEFDVSGIPGGSTVDSATLTLCPDKDPTSARTYDVHRVSASWVETTLTWNNQPSVAASATDSQTQPGSLTCTTWTVTADVQAWVDGTANNGWRVSDDDEGNGNVSTEYKTREHADTADRPLLEVMYR